MFDGRLVHNDNNLPMLMVVALAMAAVATTIGARPFITDETSPNVITDSA